MKALIMLLAIVNGAYMLLDGIYVMIQGKFIGPEKPGPWGHLFEGFHIDVFKLGPLFIVFGLAWLIWLCSFWTNKKSAYRFGLIICLLTLWYIPFGTMISLIVMTIIHFFRKHLGL